MINLTKKASKWAIAGFIILIVFGIGFFIYLFYPFNFNDRTIPDGAELRWEGEVTDKFYKIEVDHEVYYFELNGTIEKAVGFKGYWDSFSIGDYVYAFYFNDIVVITNNKETY